MDLSKQPGAQPRGSEAALPDNIDALEAYVDRWYALTNVKPATPTRGARRAPEMPAYLQQKLGGGGRR